MCGFPPVLIDAIKRGAKVQYKSRIPYQVWLPSLNHESGFARSIVINNQNLKSSRRDDGQVYTQQILPLGCAGSAAVVEQLCS